MAAILKPQFANYAYINNFQLTRSLGTNYQYVYFAYKHI